MESLINLLSAGWTVEIAVTGDGPEYTLIMCNGRESFRVIGRDVPSILMRADYGEAERLPTSDDYA